MIEDTHRLDTLDQVRAIIGEPNPAVRSKLFRELDETAIAFIARSPMVLVATVDEHGAPDISPKGDEPGFVAVEGDRTLLIPDRRGNKLLFTLQNILANGRVALFFLLPGTDETLRVQGRAELTADPAILERLRARGQPALLAIRVHVDTCFFHCAKAFKRSRLWQSDSWSPRRPVSWGKLLAPRLGGGEELAQAIDQMVEEDEKNL
jgi:uncharacterized protein